MNLTETTNRNRMFYAIEVLAQASTENEATAGLQIAPLVHIVMKHMPENIDDIVVEELNLSTMALHFALSTLDEEAASTFIRYYCSLPEDQRGRVLQASRQALLRFIPSLIDILHEYELQFALDNFDHIDIDAEIEALNEA